MLFAVLGLNLKFDQTDQLNRFSKVQSKVQKINGTRPWHHYIGLLSNVYGQFFGGNAFVIMVYEI